MALTLDPDGSPLDSSEQELDAHAFLTGVEDALNACKSVSNVRITRPPNDRLVSSFRLGIPVGLSDGGQAYPHLPLTHVGFRVDADAERLKHVDRLDFEAHTADRVFYVGILYGSTWPIVLVSEAGEHAMPSLGVVYVREILRNELPSGSGLRLEALPPTPMHADCYLVPLDGLPPDVSVGRDGFGQRNTERLGSDRVEFCYDATRYDPALAIVALHRAVLSAAEAYYDIAALGIRLSRRWSSIDSAQEELVALERACGLAGGWRRTTQAKAALSDLTISLAEFEGEVRAGERSRSQRRDEIAVTDPAALLIPQIDAVIRDAAEYPVEQVGCLTSLFEARRANAAQNRSSVVAGAVGAILGVSLTLLLSGGRPSNSVTTVIERTSPAHSPSTGTQSNPPPGSSATTTP